LVPPLVSFVGCRLDQTTESWKRDVVDVTNFQLSSTSLRHALRPARQL
jgi:hypothetical protein